MKGIDGLNSGKGKRTSRLLIGGVAAMLIAYTLTCYIIIDKCPVAPEKVSENTYSGNSGNYADGIALGNTEANNINADETALPVPDSGSSAEWKCGIYYSDITQENMKAYLISLSAAGWRDLKGKAIDTNIPRRTAVYDLSNGDHLLQLVTFLEDPTYALGNSILVYYDENSSFKKMQSREGAYKKEEALPLIQARVEELSESGKLSRAKEIVTGLFEIAIENAYEKLQLQAYAAISDRGFTGSFLVRKGVASYVPGNLANAYVADIDQDGSYELVDAYTSWEANTFRLELAAYEYINPVYFSSYTEIPVRKYYNCYVPANGYEKLRLVMDKDKNITLAGEKTEYGRVTVKDGLLCITGEKTSGLLPWAEAFDQEQLLTREKTIPAAPPEITITLGEAQLDYIIQKTKWAGRETVYSSVDTVRQIDEKGLFNPTVYVGTAAVNKSTQRLAIDFGGSMPDSIRVYDAMLNDNGEIRYNLANEQAVQIMDNSHVEFPLTQHMAYYLSSSSYDYERDWRRLFRVVCTWGEDECTYAFILNTAGEKLFKDPSGPSKSGFLG